MRFFFVLLLSCVSVCGASPMWYAPTTNELALLPASPGPTIRMTAMLGGLALTNGVNGGPLHLVPTNGLTIDLVNYFPSSLANRYWARIKPPGVPESRTLTAGAGLTGGGNLSADRTFDVGAGTGITVNANDVAISNTAVTPGGYGSGSQVGTFTVNQQGQLTAAANTSIAIAASQTTSGTFDIARIPVITLAKGGTGADFSSATDFSFLYKDSTVLVALSPNTSTSRRYIGMTGTGSAGAAPTWTQISLANDVEGNLPVNRLNDGTSASSSTFWRGDGTWATPSGGSGTVTSVALTAPSILSVSGSPITTSGTLALTLANQNANLVFSGPSSGSAAAPTFRGLVQLDIPSLDAAKITSGTFDIARIPVITLAKGGTAADFSSSANWSMIAKDGSTMVSIAPNTTTTKKYLTMTGTGAAGTEPGWNVISASDMPVMIGADGTDPGVRGAVPAPAAQDNVKFLRGDASWAVPSGAIENVSAETIGAGTDYPLTDSYAQITFGTTSPTVTLPSAGKYLITALVAVETSGSPNDGQATIFCKLRTSGGTDIGPQRGSEIHAASGSRAQIVLSSIRTAAGSETVQIHAFKASSGAVPFVEATETTISYVKLAN